ncbi:unnamed protein product [Sympodiomycopsis kandeliae]
MGDCDDSDFEVTGYHAVKTIFTDWSAAHQKKQEQRRRTAEQEAPSLSRIQGGSDRIEIDSETLFTSTRRSHEDQTFAVETEDPIDVEYEIPIIQRQSLSPPRSRSSRSSPASSDECLSTSRNVSITAPRHLDRVRALFADQSILATRLYQMCTEDGGPMMTIVDRHLQANFSDSIVPFKGLEWYPSGKITSRLHFLSSTLQYLRHDVATSLRDTRRSRRSVNHNLPANIAQGQDISACVLECLSKGGRSYPLELFRTPIEEKGWAICPTVPIPSDSIVIMFTGEIITCREATRREAQAKGRYMLEVNGFDLVYDAWKDGGPARYLNDDKHNPNLVLSVYLDDPHGHTITKYQTSSHSDLQDMYNSGQVVLPLVLFTATREIQSFEELTFNYDSPDGTARTTGRGR